MTRKGRAALVALLVGVLVGLGLLLPQRVEADATRSMLAVPSKNGFVADTSIGLGASSEAVNYATGLTDFGGEGAFCVCVQNIGSNDLLFQLIPVGTPVAASELTTATNGVASRVDVISATYDDWVCYNGGKYAGHRWQTKDVAATSARVRFQY